MLLADAKQKLDDFSFEVRLCSTLRLKLVSEFKKFLVSDCYVNEDVQLCEVAVA